MEANPLTQTFSQISGRLLSLLCFPCWGPSAWCWRPLLLHRAREPRGPTWSSRPDGAPLSAYGRGRVLSRCGPLPSGRRPFFFPLLPLPVESRRKPLIACPSATERRPTGPCPLRRRKLRASTATRNGAALHSVVIPPNDSGKRPVAYLPAGRHFFKEYPHAPR